MASIDEFKVFVKSKPSLINFVNDGSMTWQKFYDMFNLFGGEDNVWRNYEPKVVAPSSSTEQASTSVSDYRLKDFAEMFKNMNMEKLQGNIKNLQKGISFIQDYFLKDKGTSVASSSYIPRPVNKFFED